MQPSNDRAVARDVQLIENSKADSDRLLTYSEVAHRMNVSVHTVRGWVYQRRIPHLKAGRSVRFVWAHVLQWLQSNGDQKEHDQ